MVRMRSPVRIWPAAPSSKQSPLCSGDFFMQKLPSARSLASPLQHKPTSLGFVLALRQKGFFRESGFFASIWFWNPAVDFSPTHTPTHGKSSFHYLIMENRKKARANLSPTFFVLLLFPILRSFLDDLLLYIVRFVHYLVPVWNVHCFVHPEAHLVHHFKIRCSRALIRVCPDPSPRQIG